MEFPPLNSVEETLWTECSWSVKLHAATQFPPRNLYVMLLIAWLRKQQSLAPFSSMVLATPVRPKWREILWTECSWSVKLHIATRSYSKTCLALKYALWRSYVSSKKLLTTSSDSSKQQRLPIEEYMIINRPTKTNSKQQRLPIDVDGYQITNLH